MDRPQDARQAGERSSRMTILLLGETGQLGGALAPALGELGEVIAPARAGLDLTRPDDLAATVAELAPEIIVNAAAYTAVDAAEADQRTADLVNHLAVGALARQAKALGALLVHYSTDYVFDGEADRPYVETDPTHPLSVYGTTKRDGERAIFDAGCRHLIFRAGWIHAPRRSNFVRTILKLAATRDEISIVGDQVGTPTGAALMARVTASILRQIVATPPANPPDGIYHLAAAGSTSWYDYARFIVETVRRMGLATRLAPENVIAIPTSAYPTAARRPRYSVLDTTRLRTRFGVSLPPWQRGVEETLAALISAEAA
jgi:dTDP-4-dehydrorhamnose reductase